MDELKSNCQSCTREEMIFTFLVVFMAWGNVYSLPNIPLSIGEILFAIALPFFLKRGLIFPLKKYELGFSIYFFYMVVSSLFFLILFDAPLSKIFSVIRPCYYWMIIFFLGTNYFKKFLFVRLMILFSVSLSVFIILQLAVYLFSGYYIPGLFLNFPINDGLGYGFARYQHTIGLASWQGFIRPAGFLIEPAQCAQFLFISIMTLIFADVIPFLKKFVLIALMSIAIVATQSATGIVMLLFAFLVYACVEKRLSLFRWPLGFFFLMVVFLVLEENVGVGFSSVDRLVNIANDSDIDGSSNLRLNNGLNLFKELPFIYKIFGTGMGLFEYVSENFKFGDVHAYMNALSVVLFSSGLIGLLIWLLSLLNLFACSSKCGKFLVLGFFVMSLGCSIFCQPQMVWFFCLILNDAKCNFNQAKSNCFL